MIQSQSPFNASGLSEISSGLKAFHTKIVAIKTIYRSFYLTLFIVIKLKSLKVERCSIYTAESGMKYKLCNLLHQSWIARHSLSIFIYGGQSTVFLMFVIYISLIDVCGGVMWKGCVVFCQMSHQCVLKAAKSTGSALFELVFAIFRPELRTHAVHHFKTGHPLGHFVKYCRANL